MKRIVLVTLFLIAPLVSQASDNSKLERLAQAAFDAEKVASYYHECVHTLRNCPQTKAEMDLMLGNFYSAMEANRQYYFALREHKAPENVLDEVRAKVLDYNLTRGKISVWQHEGLLPR